MALERRRILYSGQVQGVGFRASASRLARGFAVVGFVRNLDDGRVEVVVEGDGAELDRFGDEIRAQMVGYIRDVESTPLPTGSPPFADFGVRF